MEYIDGEGNILIPKSVRPIIDYTETNLGSKNGAKKQYRYGNLHVREYENHYSVHMDKVDPRIDPIGHLVKDAPEYVIYGIISSLIGLKTGTSLYKRKKSSENGNQLKSSSSSSSSYSSLAVGLLVGTTTYITSFYLHNFIRKSKTGK